MDVFTGRENKNSESAPTSHYFHCIDVVTFYRCEILDDQKLSEEVDLWVYFGTSVEVYKYTMKYCDRRQSWMSGARTRLAVSFTPILWSTVKSKSRELLPQTGMKCFPRLRMFLHVHLFTRNNQQPLHCPQGTTPWNTMDQYNEHWKNTLMGLEFWETAGLVGNEVIDESRESGLSSLHIAHIPSSFHLCFYHFTSPWPACLSPLRSQLEHRPIQTVPIQPGPEYGAASSLPRQGSVQKITHIPIESTH